MLSVSTLEVRAVAVVAVVVGRDDRVVAVVEVVVAVAVAAATAVEAAAAFISAQEYKQDNSVGSQCLNCKDVFQRLKLDLFLAKSSRHRKLSIGV